MNMDTNRKNIGIALLVVGIIILAVALLADVLGLGTDPSFGTLQIIGAIIGLIIAVAGAVMMWQRRDEPTGSFAPPPDRVQPSTRTTETNRTTETDTSTEV